jgi:hypothetical protein
MNPDAVIPVLEVACIVVAVRVFWWMVGDFVLDRVDLPQL